MLAQRGADLTRVAPKAEPEKPAKGLASAGEPQVAKRKMKFKEKHALETLPSTIAALNAKASASWRRPRSNGWSLKSCARNWPATDARYLS